MFTKALTEKIRGLWPAWDASVEKVAQLGRLCSKFTDAELFPILDAMADDDEVKYFDARVLVNRVRQEKARTITQTQEAMTPRQFQADVQRRQWVKWAAANPVRAGQPERPDYAGLDDDAILALYEQQYRTEAKRVYGYVPSHYDWFRGEWAERDPPLEKSPAVKFDAEFKAPWSEALKGLGT